jgi:hypothetical protein
VPAWRSSRRSVSAAVTVGSARMRSTAYASIVQTKSGMRIHVIPGARMLWMVTMKLIAPAIEATEVRWIPRIQRSCPFPGYCHEIGG